MVADGGGGARRRGATGGTLGSLASFAEGDTLLAQRMARLDL